MNHDEFAASMAILQAAFSHEMSEEAMDVYWMVFGKVDAAQLKSAVERLVVSFTPTAACPFPVPAQIREALGDSGPRVAQRMMTMLHAAIREHGYYDSVSFGDLALHAVIARFGGWMAVSNWKDDDWKIQEGRFLDAYKVALECGDSGPKYLAGFFECDNTGRGYAKSIPRVIVYDRKEYMATGKIVIHEVAQLEFSDHSPSRKIGSVQQGLIDGLAAKMGM